MAVSDCRSATEKNVLPVKIYCLQVVTHIADFVAQEDKKLFDIADRGGLSKPSEFCYVVTSLAVVYFSTVASDELPLKRL